MDIISKSEFGAVWEQLHVDGSAARLGALEVAIEVGRRLRTEDEFSAAVERANHIDVTAYCATANAAINARRENLIKELELPY